MSIIRQRARNLAPFADAVLELLACCCTRPCKLPKCECLVNGLKCADIFSLKDCENQDQEDEELDVYGSDADGSDDTDEDSVLIFVL